MKEAQNLRKLNLPAILLKGMILLPHSELRLEFDDIDSKNIVEISEYFHSNQLLVITQKDALEENPKLSDYPTTGTIAKIEHKLELPNGKTRILLKGITRAKVHNYIQGEDHQIESIIEVSDPVMMNEEKEPILMRKLYHEIKDYTKQIPYISDSMISLLKEAKSLSEMTDIASENMPITLDRKRTYLEDYDPIHRMELLLTDVYNQKQAYEIEKELDTKVKQNFDKSQKEFLIKEKISILQKELGQIDVKKEDILKIRRRITNDFPQNIIQKIENELNRFENIPSASPEIVGVRNYIETLLSIPWNHYTENDQDLEDITYQLNQSHYGLESLKERVLEYFFIQKKKLIDKGPILCLVGPPGTGKTSFAYALAKVLKREFVKISVGGIDDSSEIIGHRRTYLGATPGRIIQGLMKVKSMNPVFLIDEIDKMVKNHKGDPSSALLDVLDSYQNGNFIDHYVDEEVDLSQIFFITTANAIEDIPYALKDRLEIIPIKGYTEYEKLEMAQDYLLPNLYKRYQLENEIVIQKDALLKVIQEYTNESGVRDLERKLSSLIRKAMIKREKTKKNIVVKEEDIIYYFKENHKILNHNHKKGFGVVNALAFTDFTGDVIPIEMVMFEGNGNIIFTGCLGEILKESVMISLSYIKSNLYKFHIKKEWIEQKDIHIHMPMGSIPKEGPSAGIAFTTLLLSYLLRKKVPDHIAFTGEISLTGQVYGIGSFKEKCIGAYKNGIDTIFFPQDNFYELQNFPQDLKKQIQFIPVENYMEIYEYLFEHKIKDKEKMNTKREKELV